jgi:flagellar basal-body rod protein FlgB
MPSFNDALGIHAEAVAVRGRRAEVLATNLANADTPGYQARDLDFRAILARQTEGAGLSRTHARHLGVTDGIAGATLGYRQPQQASLDQNTVDVQAERAAYLDNAMRYQASLTFLNGKITGIVSALRGE